MSVKVRFAPSPTGRLHVGNVRTALMNWLFARAQDGEFVLRIDDTDLERSTNEYEQGIRDDLGWLGLNWDSTFNQSHRFKSYEAAAEKLKKEGYLYPAYETAEELDRQRKLQRVQNRPPIYNRAALDLTDDERADLEAQGRKPHWRFKLSGDTVSWDDIVRGTQSIETSAISDPVLIRADGSFLYTLPSVVDDIEEKITHVIRGEDHVTNSGAQIEVFRALSDHVPQFAHTPLLVGKDGKGLSKRIGSLSMQDLKAQGFEPMAITSLLSKIGTSDPIEIRRDLKGLIAEFGFEKIGRAPARFDEDELLLLNGRFLHDTPYSEVKDHLESLNIGGGEVFWEVVRANISKVVEAAGWSTVLYSPMPGQISDDDAEFCKAAAQSLPAIVTKETWSEWTSALKAETGRKGKGLFLPLRLALTGRERGPSMADMLVLLGAEKAAARLRGETA